MKIRFFLFLRVILTILCLLILTLILQKIARPAENALTLFQKKDSVVYKINLTINLKQRQLCALLYKNRDIQEVYNIVIEDNDKFPIFPDSFKVDNNGNRMACFLLSAIPDNFSLYVIKFDSEALATNIEFPNISLASVPKIKNF
ncbi:MAG: hypothetical protein HYW34_01545 [Candidatus Brennerbacteria bacterium]|nr:hypothetical protein [Candidatus Brennerbacteria bacterium]